MNYESREKLNRALDKMPNKQAGESRWQKLIRVIKWRFSHAYARDMKKLRELGL